MKFSNLEKAACAGREVRQRERVYARLVAERKMNAKTAEREIELMREIEAEYAAKTEQAGLFE